jgi:hypothetical protein
MTTGLNRQIANLRQKIRRREKSLAQWNLSPEASIPQSSVPGIIDRLNQEIGQLSDELEHLLKMKK